MSAYTLYFKSGAKTTLHGDTQEKAFKDAQLSDGAHKNLEMVRLGDNTDYVWNSQRQVWDRRTQVQ